MSIRKLKVYIWFAVYALSVGLVIYYIYHYFDTFKGILSLHFVPFFLLALLSHGIAFFSAACAWAYMVKRHHKVLTLKLLRSYYISQITRYIPGNVWSFLARFDNNASLGVPSPATAYFLAVENLSLIGIALLFSLFAITLFSRNYVLPVLLTGIIIAIASWIVFIQPTYFRKIISLVTKKFHVQADFSELSIKDICFVFAFYVVYWALFGLSFYVTYLGIVGTNLSPILALGINAAAWLIGYVSIITPSGLGVREGVMVFMLSRFASTFAALNLALVFRFIFTLAEVLGMAIIVLCEQYAERIKQHLKRIDPYWAVLLVFVVIYILYFSFITIVRHHNLYSGRFDLGDMDQTVWNTLHGKFFGMMSPDSDKFVSRMAYHSDLLLALIAPLYWIYESAYTLLVTQSIVIGIGAIPLFLLGKKILKNNLAALCIALSLLFYPALQRVNFYDFHPVSFCITLFLFIFLFVYNKKYWLAYIFALIAILTKEEIGFVVFLLGVYLIWRMRALKAGFLFCLTGLAASFLFILVLIPHFRPNDSAHFALIFYSQYGGDTPSKVLKGMLLHPWNLFISLFDITTIAYILQLLFPAGFLAIFSPFTLLLSSSEFLINSLSNNYYMKTIYLQYTSAIIPFIFISTVFGAGYVAKKYEGWYRRKFPNIRLSLVSVLAIYVLLCSIVGCFLWGVPPIGKENIQFIFTPKNGTAIVNKIENMIPAKYSISASNSIAPHFTHRQNIYTFPVDLTNADFLIVLKHETFEIVDQDTFEDAFEYIQNSKAYTLVYQDNDFYIFQKSSLNFPLKQKILQ